MLSVKTPWQQFDKALEDAKKCVSVKPDWGKGYGREGAAYHGLGDLDRAVKSYKKGLEVEPGWYLAVDPFPNSSFRSGSCAFHPAWASCSSG